jgi:hypothetical protein
MQFATLRQHGLCSERGGGKRRNAARKSGGIGQALPFGECDGKTPGKRITGSGRIDTLGWQLWNPLLAPLPHEEVALVGLDDRGAATAARRVPAPLRAPKVGQRSGFRSMLRPRSYSRE